MFHMMAFEVTQDRTSIWPVVAVLAVLALAGLLGLHVFVFDGKRPWRRRPAPPPGGSTADSVGVSAAVVTTPVQPAAMQAARVQAAELPVDHASAEPRGQSGIFISYRRQDEPNFAGRLYDRLAAHFGRDIVFIDVDTIDLGLDFADVIDQSLAQCRVMIVVIGRSWLTVTDEEGEPRLDNPDDYVRLEVEKALHSDTRVIPVLVEGAMTPKASQLPAPLASLSRRNGIEMAHASFTSDALRLIATLDRILAEPG